MSSNARTPPTIRWDTAHGPLIFGPRMLVMGILNVTPDSFSDGGAFLDPGAAVARARQMQSEGADVIDLGGESTRPGALPVSAAEQLSRVTPVLQGARQTGVTLPISIDTRLADVAAAALDAGADIINDVSAARHDPAMATLIAKRRAPFVAMHMQGTPESMQTDPTYGNVVAEVALFFQQRAAALAAEGVDITRMIVDPGIGFGKTIAHNLELLRNLDQFSGLHPVMIGASRKGFLGKLLNLHSADDVALTNSTKAAADIVVALHCAFGSASVLRVHDIAPTVRLVRSLQSATSSRM